ncbi:unnamed protein product [Microthlaspi erraticum]|uniref:Uncharacterized protein n=1 Tax=Microthlaspi erraticum TaxID=1685480 RepID=A0A6D2IK65_9BRAS|nr:unnamed protein product [Microthlaspi erraticum]
MRYKPTNDHLQTDPQRVNQGYVLLHAAQSFSGHGLTSWSPQGVAPSPSSPSFLAAAAAFFFLRPTSTPTVAELYSGKKSVTRKKGGGGLLVTRKDAGSLGNYRQLRGRSVIIVSCGVSGY